MSTISKKVFFIWPFILVFRGLSIDFKILLHRDTDFGVFAKNFLEDYPCHDKYKSQERCYLNLFANNNPDYKQR